MVCPTRRLVVITLVLSWSFMPSAHASDARVSAQRIRVLPPCLHTLLEDATALSYTVRALVARIERSDLIVFVRCVAFKNSSLVGRMMFITAAAGQRYLMIDVKAPDQWHAQIATVAHELQHAVEIAGASWVVDQATMAQYYRQAGITVAMEPLVFDTEAARNVGRRVRGELWMAAPSAAAPESARHR